MLQKSKLEIRQEWLITNPTPRLPVVLCLDCSPSMSGRVECGAAPGTIGVPIDELNRGVKCFFSALKRDQCAKYAAEIAIITFSSTVRQILDFDFIDKVPIPTLHIDENCAGTSIGSAVALSMDILEKVTQDYRNAGVAFHYPWLVLMTDGHPTDKSHFSISKKLRMKINQKRWLVLPIGIGSQADMKMLSLFSIDRPPLRLQHLNFVNFFNFLSCSISQISRSIPSDQVVLDWEELKKTC